MHHCFTWPIFTAWESDLSEQATTHERREGEGSGCPELKTAQTIDLLPCCGLPLFAATRGHEKTTSRGGFVVGTGEFLGCFDLIGGNLTTSAPSRGRGSAPLHYTGIVTSVTTIPAGINRFMWYANR